MTLHTPDAEAYLDRLDARDEAEARETAEMHEDIWLLRRHRDERGAA